MSLDVYLKLKDIQNLPSEPIILIRENGQVKEISREEWDKRFPNREPIMVELPSDTNMVYTANITHNLSYMAKEAGIYECLWRPEDIGISIASELIEPLIMGLRKMKSDPEIFKVFNPSNGWGNYEGLVSFVEEYLNACKQFPEAEVSVWR